jgi:protein-S-isoprenylcysteine O-methyltransferase Ste14
VWFLVFVVLFYSILYNIRREGEERRGEQKRRKERRNE